MTAAGVSNAEIGELLRMSPLTAKTHVSRIITKLAVRDRAQRVVLAYETGLVRPGPSAEPSGNIDRESGARDDGAQ